MTLRLLAPHHRKWAFSVPCFFVLLLLMAAASSAAEAVRKLFDIPAGRAEKSLRRFSSQSGLQVIFPTAAVHGIRTQTVQGEFTIREALEHLLAKTPLRVVQDDQTGALTVIRQDDAEPPPGHAPTPSASFSPPGNERLDKPMKRRNPLALLGAWLALALAPSSEVLGADAPPGANQGTGSISGRVQNVATGQYLNQARVSLQGTSQVVYTDNFGVYQLVNVPAGPATLEVFYTGLDLAQVNVVVPAGGNVERDVDLTSLARYGQAGSTVALDAFVVSSDRETDAQSIANNEQRFAPNIKNVMATDSLGDVLGSSVGEFLKFIPGVTAEYDHNDIAGISLRGIGGAMTSITSDGAPSSNIWVSATRSVDVRSMGLNDIARIEVTKVPTPANPADSLAGAVNMVGKSAFERSGRQLRYGFNLVGHHENLVLKKTPHSHLDRNTYKILPGGNFDLTLPIGKNFGIVIAGMHTNVYNEQHLTTTTWANAGSGTNGVNASPSNHFLQTYTLQDGPRNLTRNTLSIKMDWRVTRHGVLSFGQTFNRAATRIGLLGMTFNAGTNGTPTPASGQPMTWDATTMHGATGRGTITNSGGSQLINQNTDNTNLRYRFDDGLWKIEAGASRSASSIKRRYHDAGFFGSSTAVNNRPVRVSFYGIGSDKPEAIEVYDNNNQPFDWYDITNFRGNVSTNPTTHNRALYNTGYLNLQRRLESLPFPVSIQVGGHRRYQEMDLRLQSINWTFRGPDGNSQTTAPLQPYIMQVYKNQDSHFGFRDIQWMSSRRTWEAYLENPLLYSKTVAQQYNEENYRIQNSEHIEETVDSAYVQLDARFLDNRLYVLTGVRFEKTTSEGQGALIDTDAVWQRDADGNFVRDAAGNRIRKPEAGAVNSPEQILLTHTERGAHTHRTYDGYYPSIHFTYNVNENLLVRAAYAKTYGRPNFTDIIPRTTVSQADLDEGEEEDPTIVRGTLNVRNPTLAPWTANNFDVSAEYYTQQGGLLSVGVFLKDIKDFFGDSAKIATLADLEAMGLDARYVGWNLVTKFNSGDAQIKGGEINLRHSLRFLGRWGQHFTVFANGTRLILSGHQQASFTSFIPKSGNVGITFSRKRATLTLRCNYRGQDRRLPQAAFGPGGYEYLKSRVTMDMSASYQLTRRLSLNASVSNMLNSPLIWERYGDNTPAYARQLRRGEYGIPIAVGIKGVF